MFKVLKTLFHASRNYLLMPFYYIVLLLGFMGIVLTIRIFRLMIQFLTRNWMSIVKPRLMRNQSSKKVIWTGVYSGCPPLWENIRCQNYFSIFHSKHP